MHHRPGGGFRNPWPGSAPHGVGGLLKWMFTRSRRNNAGEIGRVPVERLTEAASPFDQLRVTWIGHSSFLIQANGIAILTDPIWSERASPVAFAGPRRLVPPGLSIEELPNIDVTLLSHDHYDHLDDDTVRSLIYRFPAMQWYVPLGVGHFLESRGASFVTELDWWDEVAFASATFGCTPAQHFSGRFPWNRNATLWCGWAVNIQDKRVFFAGDTALHPDFDQIAMRFGPFNLAILPIGAYDPRWFMHAVHMDPGQAVKAFVALQNANGVQDAVMLASHWGTFRLTDEPVNEPPALARHFWTDTGLPPDRLWILAHGESRSLL